MSLSGARVLLTGGTGFVGSNLAAALHAQGCAVHLLVRPSSRGDLLGPLWGELPRVAADLGDPASLAAAVKTVDPEYAFHLAKERGGASFEREARATTALAAALAAHAPRLKRWVRTAHAAPESLGRGADAALARALAARYGLSITTLELHLVYGPGMGAGEPLRVLAEAAAAGADVAPPAQAKDLVFVGDAARAYVLAAESADAAGAWIPVGGGRLVTGQEAARAALGAAGRGPEALRPAAAVRPQGHPADLRPAADLLGWTPTTSLDDGMRQLLHWSREQREAGRG